MGVEFIGYIGNNNSSETIPRTGPILDPDHVATVAKAHELVGFDRALLAFHSTLPDCLQVGQFAASVTERLNIFIAQRPGFTSPTLFARQFATLDRLTKGRISLNVITGGDSRELAQDGDTIEDKDDRYARTSEFLDVVRKEWTSETPFDHQGRFYTVKNGFSQIKPHRAEGVEVFIAGASDAAVQVAGRHADVFALWGETLDQVRELTGRVRATSQRNGRATPRFSLSFRPILADTEEEAWAKAESILARAKALIDISGYKNTGAPPPNEGSRRLLEVAGRKTALDRRLWTGIAELTGAKGNSTALVGTPDQVAEALVNYYDLGVEIFLVRGFNPLVDAIQYGRELIPRVKALVAERERTRGLAAE